MKNLFTLIFLILGVVYSHAQHIFGKITGDNGKALIGATIEYQGNHNAVTDEKGHFYLKVQKQKSLPLIIRHIGYETIDTVIIVDEKSEVFLNIKLQIDLEELPNVEIKASIQNVFKDYPHHIVDFTISKDEIFVILKKGRKSYLGKANMKGIILEEIELDSRYHRFHNSCLEGVILVGQDICAEVHEVDDELMVTNIFDTDLFEKHIVPCQVEISQTLIFKGVSRHNKRVDYFRYYNDHEPHILYTVYDEDSEKVARSYYKDLLGMYFYQSENVDEDDIDAGFERDNLILDGTWTGDIQDLVITNLTHEYAMKYEALGLQSVKTDLFVVDASLYILDEFNQQILKVDEELEAAMKVDDFVMDGDVEIISDYKEETYLLIEEVLFEVKSGKNEISIHKVAEMEGLYFVQRNLLYGGVLYRLGRSVRDKMRRTFVKVEIDSLNK